MPARTGKQYLTGLKEQEREVWLGGERVRDVTSHKGLAGGARAIAHLYDMQHDPALREVMTFPSPSTGEPVGRSFDMPRTKEALETRSKMMLNWARATCGMMGRSPDFMNVTFAAWGAAADFFGEKRPEFADNMRRYVEFIRENDVTLTHSLINLQRSRNPSGMFNLEEGTALEVKKETSAGIVVKGARILATLGPLLRRDRGLFAAPRPPQRGAQPVRGQFLDPVLDPGAQIPVPRQLRSGPLAFRPSAGLALRGDGLRRVLRRRPGAVGARLPALRRRPARTRRRTSPIRRRIRRTRAPPRTSPSASSCSASRCCMTQALGNAHLPHTEERIGELMLYTELMRSCMRAAEADAATDRWGVMCPSILPVESTRNLMMTCYPRMIEILHLLGSSSFLIQPSEADFQGPLRADIEQYLATDNIGAEDRVQAVPPRLGRRRQRLRQPPGLVRAVFRQRPA